MRKEIDKAGVIATAKRLMKKEGPSQVSFRSVARELGCAHTNLYNYFPNAETLIYESGESILQDMALAAREGLDSATSTQARLERFYSNTLQLYLDHPGWFHLIWSYPPRSERASESEARINGAIQRFVETTRENLKYCTNYMDAHNLLHTVHAYLLGELSIYFGGRSLFKDRKALESYVVQRCVELTQLLDQKHGYDLDPASE
jgi:AcrR family transcriptional regulator